MPPRACVAATSWVRKTPITPNAMALWATKKFNVYALADMFGRLPPPDIDATYDVRKQVSSSVMTANLVSDPNVAFKMWVVEVCGATGPLRTASPLWIAPRRGELFVRDMDGVELACKHLDTGIKHGCRCRRPVRRPEIDCFGFGFGMCPGGQRATMYAMTRDQYDPVGMFNMFV